MNPETKTCQNCKNQFVIEPEDFNFYEKIKVPPPTFCPRCRLQRRLTFFNIHYLYKRKCGLCGEEKVSFYPPEAPYNVYCPQCWWGDGWDPFSFGRDYDFSRPFFEQFNELLHTAPLLGLSIDLDTARHSPYNHHAGHLKNSYLLFFADFNEDCAYGFYLIQNKSVMDSSLAASNELLYDCMNVYKVSRGVGLRSQVTESIDCYFLKDCANCQNCFASANLRNKKYHIFNKPYTKEEYFKEIKKWDLGSYRTYQEVKKLAEEHWKKFTPKPRFDEMSARSTGNYVFQAKNCKQCFEVIGAEDSKFLLMTYLPPIKDCWDYTSWGNNVNLLYECCVSGEAAANLRFCQESGLNLYNAEYSKAATGGSNLFGCVSMKKGDYAIFNKRYTEQEFNELRERIVKHMNDMPYISEVGSEKRETRKIVYQYGEFFPPDLSPHAYNETLANNFFPMTKEETLKNGYRWREPDLRTYTITKKPEDLPDHIKDAPDTILGEVIGCTTCPRGFKIIHQELNFLRHLNLPLPRRCPFCRINDKFSLWVKNLSVVKRTCYQCGAEFETSYTESEVPKILCKECYLKEVV